MALRILPLAALLLSPALAQLPTSFYGTWAGVPDVTTLGPFNETLTFVIGDAGDGTGALMMDVFGEASDVIPGSVQRFYVSKATNAVTYCGVVDNFFSTDPNSNATVTVVLAAQSWGDKSVTWCDATYGCDWIQWQLTLLDANTLTSSVQIGQPVNHLLVTFTRSSDAAGGARLLAAAPSPLPHACTFAPGSQPAHASLSSSSSSRSKCPYAALARARPAQPRPRMPTQYQFCYVLNSQIGVELSWNFVAATQMVEMTLSVPLPVPYMWIAIGFQPQWPFMMGADIVLGYLTSDGGCVRTMYANQQVGTPVDDSTLTISNSSITYNGGALLLSFTRPMNSGHNPLSPLPPPSPFENPMIMWGVGPAPATCTDAPQYHGSNRGVHIASLFNPASTFPPVQLCDA